VTEQLRPQARQTALQILQQIDTRGTYANELVDKVLEKESLPPEERRLVTELVYGTLRMQKTLDYVLDQLGNRTVDSMPSFLRCILRLGAYQILFLERIPVSAAVNEAVKLGRRFGHLGWTTYINGVLRSLARKREHLKWPDRQQDPAEYIAVRHSHPRWIVERWLQRWGFEETEALCIANNQAPPVSIRANRLRTERDLLQQRLELEGVGSQPGRYGAESLVLSSPAPIRSLEIFRNGWFTVQDESSMLIAPLLDPMAGQTVVDTCSAPGGKTTHIAEIMNNIGRIYAVDIHAGKLELLMRSCERLGITSVIPLVQDASLPFKEIPFQSVDRVLVDAPCSGLGVLRRRADARWRKTADQIRVLSELQQRILMNAAALVKPGGILVYSTCSTEPEENDKQIQAFLSKRPEFKLDSLIPWLPELLQAEPTAEAGYLQMLPHRHGTDGFFAARLIRQS
jgi:16S rRNA (cytosine967-C5)-methyltransferase